MNVKYHKLEIFVWSVVLWSDACRRRYVADYDLDW